MAEAGIISAFFEMLAIDENIKRFFILYSDKDNDIFLPL